MNNSSNNTFFQNSNTSLLVFISIWSVGILVSVICIMIIVLSRRNLIQLEFMILMVINVSMICLKLALVSQFLIAYIWQDLMFSCLYSMLNTSGLAFGLHTILTFFYYSLFQVSNVSRTHLFLVIVGLINSSRHFLIYQIGVLSICLTLAAVLLYVAYLDINQCPNFFFFTQKYIKITLPIQYAIPNVLPFIVYMFAIVYICYSRFIKRNNVYQDLSHFRKHLYLVLKFLALIFIYTISILLMSLFYTLSFFNPNSLVYFFVGYASSVSFNCIPLLLILIHSILNKTFYKIFRGQFLFTLRN